jgi:hypothetical protein
LRTVFPGENKPGELRFLVAFLRSNVLQPVVPTYFVEVTEMVDGQMLFPRGIVQFLACIVTLFEPVFVPEPVPGTGAGAGTTFMRNGTIGVGVTLEDKPFGVTQVSLYV